MSKAFHQVNNGLWRRKMSREEPVIGLCRISREYRQTICAKIDSSLPAVQARPMRMINQFIPISKLGNTALAKARKVVIHLLL